MSDTTEASGSRKDYFVDQNGLGAMLKVHRNTISKWIKDGVAPPFIEVNGLRRWLIEDVQNWARAKSSGDSTEGTNG